MITLNGGFGKGTLWGTFYLPDREVSGKGWCKLNAHLDMAVPPTDWYLPPPDSVWYPVDASPYGPRLSKIEIGDIQSVDNGLADFNPCEHSTLKGDANYLGNDGANAPFWRKLTTNPKTAFQAAIGTGSYPMLQQSFLSVMKGKPCSATDPMVHSRDGSMVRQTLSSLNDGARYYTTETILCATIAPETLQSTLTQFGVLHGPNRWYAYGYLGQLSIHPDERITWYRTQWQRPNRTTFVREQFIEYHDTASYTPAASIAWTKHPCVIEADHRLTKCCITHVRSDSPGRFQIKYDHTTDLRWFGWIPWDYYSGGNSWTTTGLIASLLVLEPGNTAECALPVEKANNYCLQAKERASLLYDPKAARRARTAAVQDVQELDSNWLENLAGVKGTMDCVKPLIQGYNACSNGDFALARKALAGSYLVYKYVVEPSISDAQNVKKDGSRILKLATTNRFSNERRRGMYTQTSVPVCESTATLSFFTTYHLRLKSNYFSQIWSALEKLGIEPTAGQIWDCIPFSFVADWFVSVGNSLRQVDAYNSMFLHRDLTARIESFKVQWPLEEEVLYNLFDGTICSNGNLIEYSWYDRRIYQSFGEIDQVAISDDNGLSSSQMVQGTALLTQMMR